MPQYLIERDVAPNEAVIRDHADRGGLPASRISQIRSVIDRTIAE